jgi:uncharacterized protein (DUF433 family)
MKARKRIELGQYIVSDPEICGGELTFKGTRMFVKDVLYFLSKGEDWGTISRELYGLPHAAIAETIKLAGEALLEKSYRVKPVKKAEKRRAA